ncbi:SDR family NAD(P)-dependent oxidoreductase [Borborobacter arsenicus]|uniref:SDR family NAD(P)-dependent oxidoreductase n=1 Tax=Borborobacter arsenicus TaxID=1851146 RepID=UPI001FE06FCF|nr:SDR family NAD(P)-dependent oxidoreductase [Pseudaminobacter arsenicus]
MELDNQSRFSLAGRTALVTGASSGIGRHIALTLVSAGAAVVLAARRLGQLDETRKTIEEMGGRALCVELDVTDRDSVERGFEIAVAEFGAIDVLVNNAGIADTASFLEMTEEAWSRVVETNLTGVWRVGQVAARIMARQGKGSIINIASALAIGVQKNQANYASAKAGVLQLTRVMAMELGRSGVRVNAIAPGYFQTEINSDFFSSSQGQAYVEKLFPRRLGTLDELDGPILLLASDAGNFITGSVLAVEGGALLKSF